MAEVIILFYWPWNWGHRDEVTYPESYGETVAELRCEPRTGLLTPNLAFFPLHSSPVHRLWAGDELIQPKPDLEVHKFTTWMENYPAQWSILKSNLEKKSVCSDTRWACGHGELAVWEARGQAWAASLICHSVSQREGWPMCNLWIQRYWKPAMPTDTYPLPKLPSPCLPHSPSCPGCLNPSPGTPRTNLEILPLKG